MGEERQVRESDEEEVHVWTYQFDHSTRSVWGTTGKSAKFCDPCSATASWIFIGVSPVVCVNTRTGLTGRSDVAIMDWEVCYFAKETLL